MRAIFKREFKSFFTTPIGYIYLAIMMLAQGWAFVDVYSYGSTDIGYIFSTFFSFSAIFLLIPVLTMRTMSDDRRQKVDQVLLTSPVSLYAIVFGKFFATLAIFMLSFAMTLVFQIIVAFQDVTMNWLIYIGNLLGVFFMGSAIIALGIFISSLTESQVVSVVISFAASLVLAMMDNVSAMVNVPAITNIIEKISFIQRYNAFCNGIIDYSNIVFFVGLAAIFIFLTVRVLDKRRYS